MVDFILNYFSLWTEVAAFGGAGRVRVRQPILFIGVLAGALSKVVYDAIQNGGLSSIDGLAFISAAIGSVVIFPHLYSEAGLSRGNLTFAKWCLAFQNGFFWNVAISSLHS